LLIADLVDKSEILRKAGSKRICKIELMVLIADKSAISNQQSAIG
jgi:hypothetical protein